MLSLYFICILLYYPHIVHFFPSHICIRIISLNIVFPSLLVLTKQRIKMEGGGGGEGGRGFDRFWNLPIEQETNKQRYFIKLKIGRF